MKIKLLFKICALMLLCSGPVQTIQAQNQVVAPSGGSLASIERIQNPVDMSSGTLTVNIPLYDIQTRSVSVPVALTYRATGIKVEEQESSVGMGWNLVSGGKITRIVKQYPDDTHEKTWGWGYDNRIAYRSFFNSVEIVKYKQYNQMNSEPDIFFLEIPGYSGVFVLDHQGNIHTIPNQNITIEWVEPTAAGANYFVVTDRNGNKYTLGSVEASKERTSVTYKNTNLDKLPSNANQEETIEYISTWHLDEIENYFGDKVEFTYQDLKAQNYTTKNILYDIETNNGQYGGAVVDMSERDVEEIPSTSSVGIKIVKDITWNLGKMEFLLSYVAGDNRVRFIKIYNLQNTLLRKVNFDYGIISGRGYLNKLSETAGTVSQDICSFTYYTGHYLPSFPPPASTANRQSYDYDAWGYYNGAGNTTNRTKFYNIPGGANRLPYLEPTKAQTLIAVNYPTGGRIEYEYELHNVIYNNTIKEVGGLRIKSIKQIASTGDYTQTDYQYYKKNTIISSGYLYNSPSFGFNYDTRYIDGEYKNWFSISSKPLNNLYDFMGRNVSYSFVTVTSRDGSYSEYEFTSEDDGDEYKDPLSKVYFNDYDMVGFDNGTINDIPEYFPNGSNFWMRGLPKSVTQISNTGGLVSRTVNNYAFVNSNLSTNNPIRIFGYLPGHKTYDTGNELHAIFKYYWQPQIINLSSTITDKGMNSFYSQTAYGYNNIYRTVSWTEVRDYNSNTSNIDKVTVKYPFDYAVSGPFADTDEGRGINLLKSQTVYNVPVETTVWKNGKVASSKFTRFEVIILGGGKQVSLPKYEYTLFVDNPVSDFEESNCNLNTGELSKDPRYELTNTLFYDEKGNAISSLTGSGYAKSNIFGYNGTLVIAEVDNAIYTVGTQRTNQVFYTGFEDGGTNVATTSGSKTGEKCYNNRSSTNNYTIDLSNFIPGDYVVTYWGSGNSSTWVKFVKFITVTQATTSYNLTGSSYFDDVSVIPVGARINTYTYKPGVGMTSATDYAGMTTYYEYDGFGRPTVVRDNDRNVVSAKEYNIAH